MELFGLIFHLITEVERRAYADRSKHIGDPGYWNVPISTLTSKEYASKKTESILMDKNRRRCVCFSW